MPHPGWNRALLVGSTLLLGAIGLPPATAATLTIEAAVQRAFAGSPDLNAQRLDLEVAQAELISARLRPNPELSIEAVNLDSGFRRGDESEYAIAAEYPLEGPGKRRQRIRVAELAVAVAELKLRDTARTVDFEVRSAAIELLLMESLLTLARENVEGLERIVTVNENRHRLGDLDGLELARSRLELRQADTELRSLEQAQRALRAEFQLLLGWPDDTEPPRIADELPLPGERLPLAHWQALAEERRPDRQAARLDVERASAEVRHQEVQRRPDVTVGTEFRRFHENGGDYVGVAVSVPVPLFDRNQGEIARARAERQQAELERFTLTRELGVQVRNAFDELATARAILETYDNEMLNDARRIRELSEVAYRRGEISLIELLDANLIFNETLAAWHEARAHAAQSLTRIEYVTAAREFP